MSDDSKALVRYADVTQAITLAEQLAKSTLLPDGLRNKPGDIFVILRLADDLKINHMTALFNMYVIKGKPVMASTLMSAMVISSPLCEEWHMVESTDAKATFRTKRRGAKEPVQLTYTIEQATKAGLLGNDNWKKSPADMLRARCSSKLHRIVYPDIILGFYTEDESHEFVEPPTAKLEQPTVSVEEHKKNRKKLTPEAKAEGQARYDEQHAEPPAAADAEFTPETHKNGKAAPAPEPQTVPPEQQTQAFSKPADEEAPLISLGIIEQDIGACESEEALRSLIPLLQRHKLAKDAPIRGVFNAKMKQLKAQAEATAPRDSMERPDDAPPPATASGLDAEAAEIRDLIERSPDRAALGAVLLRLKGMPDSPQRDGLKTFYTERAKALA